MWCNPPRPASRAPNPRGSFLPRPAAPAVTLEGRARAIRPVVGPLHLFPTFGLAPVTRVVGRRLPCPGRPRVPVNYGPPRPPWVAGLTHAGFPDPSWQRSRPAWSRVPACSVRPSATAGLTSDPSALRVLDARVSKFSGQGPRLAPRSYRVVAPRAPCAATFDPSGLRLPGPQRSGDAAGRSFGHRPRPLLLSGRRCYTVAPLPERRPLSPNPRGGHGRPGRRCGAATPPPGRGMGRSSATPSPSPRGGPARPAFQSTLFASSGAARQLPCRVEGPTVHSGFRLPAPGWSRPPRASVDSCYDSGYDLTAVAPPSMAQRLPCRVEVLTVHSERSLQAPGWPRPSRAQVFFAGR